MAAVAACVLLGSGCEWTSTSEHEAWTDAYGWVDFSGVYRALGGGPVVTGMVTTPGSSGGNVPAQDSFGQTANSTKYSGKLSKTPVVAGSVTVRLGGVAYRDNGAGVLNEVGGTLTGSITYGTGVWSVNTTVEAGLPITADYQYSVEPTEGTVNPGNTGNPIYHFTVNQTGNRLSMVDSRRTSFSGSITGTSGTSNQNAAGGVRLVFEVASSDGRIKIKGAFSGDWSGAEDGGTGTLNNRRMEGTWIEGRVQGDIDGFSGLATIRVPAAAAPAAVTP